MGQATPITPLSYTCTRQMEVLYIKTLSTVLYVNSFYFAFFFMGMSCSLYSLSDPNHNILWVEYTVYNDDDFTLPSSCFPICNAKRFGNGHVSLFVPTNNQQKLTITTSIKVKVSINYTLKFRSLVLQFTTLTLVEDPKTWVDEQLPFINANKYDQHLEWSR